MYQECADAFHAANPDVTVKITQFGWDDYWTKLTTGFVSGTAPDVFTDHLSKYPEFVKNNQLSALDDLVTQDNVPMDIYQPRAWPSCGWAQDGKRYGTAEGLGHDRALLQQGDDRRGRAHQGADGHPGVEPDRRRHL